MMLEVHSVQSTEKIRQIFSSLQGFLEGLRSENTDPTDILDTTVGTLDVFGCSRLLEMLLI